MALLALLARIGTSQPVEPVADLDALAASFDFAHFGRAPAHFDPHDVELLNAKLLHHLDFAEVKDRLPVGATEGDWLLLRGNLGHLRDVADWQPVLDGQIDKPDLNRDDRLFVREAATTAESMTWGQDPWHALTGALKESSGRNGRALFMPLRLALTGRDSGPEMAPLLARIGRDCAIRRLHAASSD
jgi:glutamyl-tRNA synthetase